ncbi:MAG: PEP-CTERM sorting domain-containing protein [Verrucomicrobiaceae bacterium]|nr:PEP-CTERM sorting domain-containing protein [Verrucomicrobiaceae bacterium]
MKFLSSLLVLSISCSQLSAAVWVDDFSGATLAATNFDTPTGSGNIQFQANSAQSRVEIASTGALLGASHNIRWDHQQTAAYDSNWSIAAQVFSGDVSVFGTFGAGDIIDLSLNVVSSVDSTDRAQFNFVVGNPFGGVIHGARFAKRTNDTDSDEVIEGGLGTGPLTGTISMQFNPATNIIAAFYDFGSGSTLLGTTNISDWNMTSGHFSFFIEGAATNITPPDEFVEGSISIPAGSLYLDSVVVATPEPSRAMLLMVGGFATLLRRRRA